MLEAKIKFEKVPEEEFVRAMLKLTNPHPDEKEVQIKRFKKIHKKIMLPTRATAKSAGYDIYAPFSVQLGIGNAVTIPTGIRCIMDDDIVLLGAVRSSLGIKHGIRIANTMPVIDADYSNAENYGHIMIKIINTGIHDVHTPRVFVCNENDEDENFVLDSRTEELAPIVPTYFLTEGDRFCQLIATKYYIDENDRIDNEERIGGIGSTGN